MSAAEAPEWLRLECVGTRNYPGCGKHFLGTSSRLRFCPLCATLDKRRSFVFVERRRQKTPTEEE